ncbi:MAG: hypothetical protein KJ621_17410, partial [Proteobacteria bacterium]|nr:hypothetical protein [Pseudomonadota bacterium]
MTPLSIACIILGCYYAGIRFPLAIAPNTTVKMLKVFWGSETSTRIFGIAWLIPWIIAVYFSFQSDIRVSWVISIWGIIGTVFSLYIIIFASKYSQRMKIRIENITPGIRVFALLTAFAGVFLIYLGIR